MRQSKEIMEMSAANKDAAELRELWDLLCASAVARRIRETLHAKTLLAEHALRRVLEQGTPEEDIAILVGTTPDRVRLVRQCLSLPAMRTE